MDGRGRVLLEDELAEIVVLEVGSIVVAVGFADHLAEGVVRLCAIDDVLIGEASRDQIAEVGQVGALPRIDLGSGIVMVVVAGAWEASRNRRRDPISGTERVLVVVYLVPVAVSCSKGPLDAVQQDPVGVVHLVGVHAILAQRLRQQDVEFGVGDSRGVREYSLVRSQLRPSLRCEDHPLRAGVQAPDGKDTRWRLQRHLHGRVQGVPVHAESRQRNATWGAVRALGDDYAVPVIADKSRGVSVGIG